MKAMHKLMTWTSSVPARFFNGLIPATHDLELGELEEKSGNALYLMKMVGIEENA